MCAEVGSGDRVLGIDLGGTRCRALLADTTGTRYGTGYAGGAHPGSAPAAALRAVSCAVTAALRGTAPAAVRAVVLGAAGYAALTEPPTAAALSRVWRTAGLHCPVQLRPDCEIAFAAGTPEPDGTVLIAGTGSMAARIVDRTMVARAGGHGWLLGDEGSGYWLGRQAVRTTLRSLETGRPAGALVSRVLAAVLDHTPPNPDPVRTISAITTWVHREAPAGLAGLAPLVCAAARTGDAEAIALLDRASGLLANIALALWRTGEPVVLAGGLLTASPVGALVSDRLRAAGASVHHGQDPVAAAAWLATLGTATRSGNAPGTGAVDAQADGIKAVYLRLVGRARDQGQRTDRSPG